MIDQHGPFPVTIPTAEVRECVADYLSRPLYVAHNEAFLKLKSEEEALANLALSVGKTGRKGGRP